jgi:hypothetical protein
MKKLLSTLILLIGCTVLHAQDLPKIRLQVEANPQETEPYGLKVQNLQTEIMTKLIQADIHIEDDMTNPLLVLRLKSLEVESDVATFVQLAFFEQALLARNNNNVMAMTWSQASLLATSKDNYINEVTTSALAMTDAFIKDFKKAFNAKVPAPKKMNAAPTAPKK